VGKWNAKHPNELLPEMAFDDPGIAECQGYSESKWIAERLHHAVGKKCQLSSAICRVGQISGQVEIGGKGKWNTQEWLPSVNSHISSIYFSKLRGY
jgi:thioester reductase-like protein